MSKVRPVSTPYMVVTNQPYGISVEEKLPNVAAGVVSLPGLECLSTVDQVVVKPRYYTADLERTNFKMFNSQDQQIFEAQEDDNCCLEFIYGLARPFEINIRDVATRRVFIHVNRPFRGMCCCMCCSQEIVVTAPFAGNAHLGCVKQEHSFLTPTFKVENSENTPIYRIKGPKWAHRYCSDGDFKVLTVEGSHEVGHIRKKWKGFAPEAATDASNFGIKFPMDLDVKMKATLLGATFLIDFLYFEKGKCGFGW